MTVCGIKPKKNVNDIFLSIEERRVYDDQVGTIIAVNADGKCVGNLIDIFEDGSIHLIPGNDAKKLGLKLDGEGKLFAKNHLASSGGEQVLYESTKPICKLTKSPKDLISKHKHFPITHVVDSQCSGIKSGCKTPCTVALVYIPTACPPVTTLVLKEYYSGNQITTLFAIYPDGTVDIYNGVSSGYGLDLATNGYIKIRGKLPHLS
jgi:hypothetical protein